MSEDTITIIDTFPAFLSFWEEARYQEMDIQMAGWEALYKARWPELYTKQLDDYEAQGEDWRDIARERIFPNLDERLPAMKMAQSNLTASIRPIYHQARAQLGFDSPVNFVIYVGIGCGAGWVTTYDEVPAVLFGLENIAECGWSRPPALTGLIAHELGHVAHFHWRAEQGLANGSGAWWQLYSEGFAQRCENLIVGPDSWHMQEIDADSDWLAWCHAHRGWLASEFLRMADAGETVRPFFGSWFDIKGRKQTGYYVGHEIIRSLESSLSLAEIALLDGQDYELRLALEKMAAGED